MKRIALAPLALAALVYLPCSGGRGVIDYDEGYYAQVARRMAETGDWVTPYADGVRFLEKPPLMYWVTAASLSAFGASELALRLPSALAVVALVAVVMLVGRRAGSPRAAAFAGLATAFSVGTCLFTREALHDVWLVLFLALAMHAFLAWRDEKAGWRGHALLFSAALAGGVMTKSLVGVVLPLAIVALFFVLAGERPDWARIPVLPMVFVFLALAGPWHVLAAHRNPGFLRAFFVNEQLLRFLGRHDPPVLWSVPLAAFWGLVLVWLFPWTAFLPAGVAILRREAGGRRTVARLAVAWAAVVLGFFSFSDRLEHYAFPALPALALLVGLALDRTGDDRLVTWGFRGLALLGIGVLAAAVVGVLWLGASTPGPGPGAGRESVLPDTDFTLLAEMPPAVRERLGGPAAAMVAALAIGFPLAWWRETRGRRTEAVLGLAGVMIVFAAMTEWSLVICEDLVSSKGFALAVAREARPGDHLVVVGDYESANSLSFYQPLPVEVCGGVAYALIPGMKYADAPRIVLTRGELEALWRSNRRVFALVPKASPGPWDGSGSEMMERLDRRLVRNH